LLEVGNMGLLAGCDKNIIQENNVFEGDK